MQYKIEKTKIKIDNNTLSSKSFLGVYTTPDPIIPQIFPFRKAIFALLKMVFYQSQFKINSTFTYVAILNMEGDGSTTSHKMFIGPNPKMYRFTSVLCRTSSINYLYIVYIQMKTIIGSYC